MPNVTKLLVIEEGCRNKPYYCKLGYPTIGIGQRIGPKGAPLDQYPIVMPNEVAAIWLNCNLRTLAGILKQDPVISAAWVTCNDARQAILLSMAYQMGVDGLRKFRNTLQHIARSNFELAASEMLDSAWASPAQTPERARRHAEQMRTGIWHNYYHN